MSSEAEERKYTTLIDLLPPVENKSEYQKMIRGIQEQMFDQGKIACSGEEMMFLVLLERHINIFEKAKSMIANERFTVEFKGDPENSNFGLQDFAIIPIVKNESNR